MPYAIIDEHTFNANGALVLNRAKSASILVSRLPIQTGLLP